MIKSIADIIIYEDLQSLQKVLKDQHQINIYDEYGFTPLTQACFMNKIDIARWLLTKGANPNIADLSGYSALHWAVDNNNLELVKLLLDYKADPNNHTEKSQPILVFPLLRRQDKLVNILTRNKAN